MAINWDGFIMGVGDFAVDRIKEERQLRMQQELERMRSEREEAVAIRKENREEARARKKVKGSRDSADQPGMVEDVNEYGEVVGTRALDEFTRQQRDQDKQKFALDLANTQSQIDARNRQLQLDAERNAIARDRNSIERNAASAASGGDGASNDALALLGILGFKAPTGGDGITMRNWTKAQGVAEQALRWGKENNMSPENVLQRVRLGLQEEGVLENRTPY